MHRILQKLHNFMRRVKVMKNWPLFMWPLNRIGAWPRTAVLRSGARIVLRNFRSTDFAIFNEIAIDDVYGITLFKTPKHIVDIGANIGIFSIIVAKKFPTATVISIEPEHHNYEALKRNVELSNATNITLVKKAIAAQAGTASLHINPNNTGAHSLHGIGEAQTVNTATLAEFLPADILKVDCEGAEYEIFEHDIPDCARIVMETHDGNDKKLFERLAQKYRISSQGKIHILEHK